MKSPVLVWFRQDLRPNDNPALTAAFARGGPVIPIFIWAPDEEGGWPPGAASRWWLQNSLQSLDAGIRRLGGRLIFRRGPSLGALRSMIRECGAEALCWNRRYEPAIRERDAHIEKTLRHEGICIETYNAALLFEPDEVKNRSGKPFTVFSPFWRACSAAVPYFIPAPPRKFEKIKWPSSLQLADFSLEPDIDRPEGLQSSWEPGEAGARKTLERFLDNALEDYGEMRDFPAAAKTSRLSPYLHFGEISPSRVWAACADRRGTASRAFLRQLAWREFAYHLLYHFPHTASEPLRPQFLHFPWRKDEKALKAWQRGLTGYPMVDAAMRELCATGWMHNRARMVAASFLVKDLLLSWLDGARWFWDTLVDADLANNTLGWQWVAGCVADAAPYFRMFNPALQAVKLDADGAYVSRWVPEVGTPRYPPAIVDHDRARERTLRALEKIKKR